MRAVYVYYILSYVFRRGQKNTTALCIFRMIYTKIVALRLSVTSATAADFGMASEIEQQRIPILIKELKHMCPRYHWNTLRLWLTHTYFDSNV